LNRFAYFVQQGKNDLESCEQIDWCGSTGSLTPDLDDTARNAAATATPPATPTYDPSSTVISTNNPCLRLDDLNKGVNTCTNHVTHYDCECGEGYTKEYITDETRIEKYFGSSDGDSSDGGSGSASSSSSTHVTNILTAAGHDHAEFSKMFPYCKPVDLCIGNPCDPDRWNDQYYYKVLEIKAKAKQASSSSSAGVAFNTGTVATIEATTSVSGAPVCVSMHPGIGGYACQCPASDSQLGSYQAGDGAGGHSHGARRLAESKSGPGGYLSADGPDGEPPSNPRALAGGASMAATVSDREATNRGSCTSVITVSEEFYEHCSVAAEYRSPEFALPPRFTDPYSYSKSQIMRGDPK
jgi:hypothetical protein